MQTDVKVIFFLSELLMGEEEERGGKRRKEVDMNHVILPYESGSRSALIYFVARGYLP